MHNRMIRLPEVMALTGMKKSFIYSAMRENRFPKNIKLGARCRAWLESDIQEWINRHLISHS
jgi:prophage regulatory protein